MPLYPGKSNIGRNIKTEEKAGKPYRQALAIALNTAKVPKARKHASGGIVGPLSGVTPGRADKLPVDVPAGSHVIPADVVAALGDGNSNAGLVVLDKKFGRKRRAAGGRVVPCALSDGEYIVSPEEVMAAGGGDPRRGHAALDHFIVSTRQRYQSHLAKLPGPVKS